MRPRLLLLLATAAAIAVPPVASAAVPTLELRVDRAVPDGRKAPARLTLPGYDGRAGVELRGNHNATHAKKAYSLETRGRGTKARNVRLLGLPRENDFVLDPAVLDPTRMRNVVAYAASRRMGRWAPRTRFVELRLNGRPRGLYVLTERPKLDAARVAVERRGITGGYLLELTDRPERGAITGPVTGATYLMTDPERDDASAAEERFAAGYVAGAERALHGGGDWRRWFDEAAAVDHLLLQELVRNQDAFRRSTFLAKGTDGPLVLGPVWDLDLSMGTETRPGTAAPDGWTTPGRPLAGALLRDPAFAARVAARWREVRAGGLREALLADVDRTARALRGAAARDARRWPGQAGAGHAAEVARLRAWIEARVAWLDANVDGLAAAGAAPAA